MDFLKQGQEVVAIKDGKITQGKFIQYKPSNEPYKLNLNCKGSIVEIDADDIVEVEGFKRPQPVYFQPRWTQEELDEAGFHSSDVYRSFDNAKIDYPDHVIDKFQGSDIEEHSMIDDGNGSSETFYVDVPNYNTSKDEYLNIYTTHHRPDALLYAHLIFHADENGMISIISHS